MNATRKALHKFARRIEDARAWHWTTVGNMSIHPALKRTPSVCNCFFRRFTICHAAGEVRKSREKTTTFFSG